MQHENQQVDEALAHYLAALEAGAPEPLDALAPDPAIRSQIEFALAEGLPAPVFAPSAAEQTAAAAVAARVQTR
ncbi:MAG: hypothetical protein H7Z42_05835, partial [Roseiflexaceae bacterium]|nr:hypothetical protein [Roseiflexaceae bacterium]